MTKILLVDDMRNFLDLEISFLRRADCRIMTAKDGLEALKIATDERPDIILLDIEMPRMNGIECCRILKANPDFKKIPVVIVSSFERRTECFKAGANDYVRKPINEEAFLKEIKKFIDIKERKDERAEVSIKADYTFKKKLYSAYSRDLSLSGIFLITSDILPLGSELPLTLDLPDGRKSKKIKVMGKVMRIVEESTGEHAYTGMGLEFVNLKPTGEKAISNFIKRAKRR